MADQCGHCIHMDNHESCLMTCCNIHSSSYVGRLRDERNTAASKLQKIADWSERLARDAKQPDLSPAERSTLWGVYWTVRGILNGQEET